ncbi:TIGR01459 family HAD-type hydrolase [Marivita sp. GX14005]|uniref:TIGR01459 family HAD-type hydrolase n=1 Tax=Marivita sp. GX14005 TaxID=2942276 RepID=UPI002019D4BE|nr:TIGR01459 family HAD-type hydrolase [Marivita sp. GX14005]MCL3881184.1 TIGR01459 family HAD-type hydrolase [Marivita sp. GX14005]
MSLTAETAFLAYEAVRARLPSPGPVPQPQRAATLAEISEDYDAFLLDAFGVLNIGETAIPGTAERIADLRAAGKRVIVVSNAASVPVRDLAMKYQRLGFDFDISDIVSSRLAMLTELARRAPRRWGVMAGHMPEFSDLPDLDLTLLAEAQDAYDDAEGFLLIGSAGWTEDRQARLEASLQARARPVLVANPDIVAPRETGFSLEPGHFAHRLADRCKISPEFFGKPFANVYDLAFEKLPGVARSRILMVGDSLHTDILGAQAVGIASALVTEWGFFAGHDPDAAIVRSGIAPTYMIERP